MMRAASPVVYELMVMVSPDPVGVLLVSAKLAVSPAFRSVDQQYGVPGL
jgi:hypothetical protein